MIIIDANALVVLLIGSINPKLIESHKRTSIYSEEDFHELLFAVGNIEKLVVLPNVWTEVDNLLNSFSGHYKYQYVRIIFEIIKVTSEKYLNSILGAESNSFYDLGLTDSLILEYAKSCEFLITSDSRLSDYAIANGIKVYDMVKIRNEKLSR